MSLIHLRPDRAIRADQTHAALMIGPETSGDLDFACGITTVAQSRQGSSANPHEVGWLVWNYLDNDHFYYLAAKPNGWELGKRDPAFAGGQEFLATDGHHGYPVGIRHQVRVAQSGATIDAWIDEEHVVTCTDPRDPYSRGRIGLYCEDSEVYFDALSLKSAGSDPSIPKPGAPANAG